MRSAGEVEEITDACEEELEERFGDWDLRGRFSCNMLMGNESELSKELSVMTVEKVVGVSVEEEGIRSGVVRTSTNSV